jgi:hypothetical protein
MNPIKLPTKSLYFTAIFVKCIFCLTVNALEIRVYKAADHDRFNSFPASPINNNTFIYSETSLSGVGWYLAPSNTNVERRRQYTMVSPKHFVGANHFRPSTSGSLRFLATDGTVRTYAIKSTQSILNDEGDASDLFIGTLETEIAPTDKIIFQPYLSIPAGADPIGTEFIFMGHNPGNPTELRAGRGVMGAFSDFGDDPVTGGASINKTRVFVSSYNSTTGNSNDAFVEAGDSGSPCIVPVGTRGAIAGTHTAVATALGTTQNFHTYVPFYISELNTIMAGDGYHMTRAVPAIYAQPSTTLSVTPTVPAILRAGYPFTIQLAVQNTGITDNANNIKLSQTLPSDSLDSATGTLWITGDELVARRGGLGTGETSTLSVNLTVDQPINFSSIITYSSDEFSEDTETLNLTIIESFRSWASALTDTSTSGDADGDGISNLHEYAFGGDPESNSQTFPETNMPLLPTISQTATTVTINFLRRKDFANRAITYALEESSTLQLNSWDPVTPSSMNTTSVNSNFEKVTANFPATQSANFFRVKITLSEE